MNIIINKANENIAKMDRSIVFGSYTDERPIGKKAFDLWNGLQVFDIDIKNRELAEAIKIKLFNRLKKYNWFFGISFSSSGKSLHVYTKIQVSEDDHKDPLKKKLLHCMTSHVISASTVRLSVYDQRQDQCMCSHVISA